MTLQSVFKCVLISFVVSASAIDGTATPIEFHVVAKPPYQLPVQPASLEGATFEVIYRLDTSTLVPTVKPGFGGTEWPTTGTLASLKISGAAALDGLYNATSLEVGEWTLSYNSNRSSISFPTAYYDIGDIELRVNVLSVYLPQSFFANSAAPIQPIPFDASDSPDWQGMGFISAMNRFAAFNLTGYAIAIPEPTSICIALSGVAFVAFTRRRSSAGARGR